MSYLVKSPRKLIEVALPLDAINKAAGHEKSLRFGYPSTLHLWWAPRPLAAARAVIFAQLVNDPGYQQGGGFKYGKNKKEAAIERKRLFKIIEDLVLWENTSNEEVLERARAEIRRSWREVCDLNRDHPQAAELFNREKLPALHDPFAGGGTIPLEAQRLGLEAVASDLNPVAVVINKAKIEVPPKFIGHPPVGREIDEPTGRKISLAQSWPGLTGLAEDVRRYGSWLRTEAERRIGDLYPSVEITPQMALERRDLEPLISRKLTAIAWLWVRTVKSPNPVYSHVDVPLASTFVLATKNGKEAYVQPIVGKSGYRFTVQKGTPPLGAADGTKAKGRGSSFRCLLSDVPIDGDYIKAEGKAGRIGARLMAVVAVGERERIYLPPTEAAEAAASRANPTWRPEVTISGSTQYLGIQPYGMTRFSQLFTDRQLTALSLFSDLIQEVRKKIRQDAVACGEVDDGIGLASGGAKATAYADAVTLYLACCLDKLAEAHSTLCTWSSAPKNELVVSTFRRQALSMTWDFAEANPFAESSGSISKICDAVARAITGSLSGTSIGSATQTDAASQTLSLGRVVSTDPPYYDNVPYADLSDFFYVWMRRSLRAVFPELFATVSAPKAEELVAFAYRHENAKAGAEAFFLEGMTRAMQRLGEQAHPAFPVTIYYAFKQAESDEDGVTSSTGWETFLDAVVRAGFAIHGTWPMRTERESRSRGIASNALASSIVLVCRRRALDAPAVSRREFQRELNATLPEALDEMTKGSGDERSPVAPVDLSQAIIGPGMAVFSKYASVLEADGSAMSVRTALQLINRFLAEDDFDPDTQFCLRWFEENGWNAGRFGDADTLSRAKGTSVDGVKDAGVVASGAGAVRLLRWAEYASGWDPKTDTRNPVWETLHHLIRALKREGETKAGTLLAAVRGQGESVRQLAYRLYTLCEREGWAEDARVYNELITSWTGIESASGAVPTEKQGNLFEGTNKL